VVDADGRPPTAICAELWARGVIDPGTGIAPPLEACVLRTGPVGVCERLGLAPLRTEGYHTTTGRIGALRDALVRRGFGDWRVQAVQGSWSAGRPCTTAEIDQATRVVTLSGEEDLSRYLRRDG
jgi:hypothetical protein